MTSGSVVVFAALLSFSVESNSSSSKLNGLSFSLSWHISGLASSAVISMTKMGLILMKTDVVFSTLVIFLWLKCSKHLGKTNSLRYFSYLFRWSSSASVTLCLTHVTYVGSQLFTIIRFILPCSKISSVDPTLTRPFLSSFLSLRASQQSVICKT